MAKCRAIMVFKGLVLLEVWQRNFQVQAFTNLNFRTVTHLLREWKRVSKIENWYFTIKRERRLELCPLKWGIQLLWPLPRDFSIWDLKGIHLWWIHNQTFKANHSKITFAHVRELSQLPKSLLKSSIITPSQK